MQPDISPSPAPATVHRGQKRPGLIDCAAYSRGVRIADVAIEDIGEELKHEDRFVWVGLFEPDEELLHEIQEEFGLHDLAIEDAHSAHQRPKLEQYEDACLWCCARPCDKRNTPLRVR